MAHILIALALQAIIAIPLGNWWAGAAAGAFMFVGHERLDYWKSCFWCINKTYGDGSKLMPCIYHCV